MQKKIKILHIQESILSGGVERRRLSLARHLDKTLFEQKFVCTFAEGNIPDEIRAEGFEVIPIGELKSPFQWAQHKKIQKIIDDYQPDIVHGAVFEGVTMAALNGWIKRVPKIIIEETSYPMTRSKKANILMKFFGKISHKIIGVSSAVTDEYLLRTLKLPKEKVVLINNGVRIPRTINEIEILKTKQYWNISEDDFVVGTLGRMQSDTIKRYSDLIYAFAKFSQDKKNVKLMLVGGTLENIQEYKVLVDDLKINNKVIFTLYQPDVTLYYKLMDVFAMVSATESFGLSLAEAMLNKLPVVATKVGGMKYIVDHDETGILVQRFKIDEIADSLNTLYYDQELRLKMGVNGFSKAMKEYTEEAYVQKVTSLYLKLTSK